MINLILNRSPTASIWHGIVFVVLVVLVIGLYLRQFWAYLTSLVFLFFSLTVALFNTYVGNGPVDALSRVTANGFFQSLPVNAHVYLLEPLEKLIKPLQLLAVGLALAYGILRIGPDFERVKTRLLARLDKGLNDASQYYATGQDYARNDMWATAVLHFQRAVALNPIQMHYQKSLAIAYARIGFYRRSLDMLESAGRFSRNQEAKSDLERLKSEIQFQLSEDPADQD